MENISTPITKIKKYGGLLISTFALAACTAREPIHTNPTEIIRTPSNYVGQSVVMQAWITEQSRMLRTYRKQCGFLMIGKVLMPTYREVQDLQIETTISQDDTQEVPNSPGIRGVFFVGGSCDTQANTNAINNFKGMQHGLYDNVQGEIVAYDKEDLSKGFYFVQEW